MSPNTNKDKFMLSNREYNHLKFFALVVIPGLGALYFGLAQIWGLPKAEEIVGSITVIDTFMGVLLGISTKRYNQSDAQYGGQINVEESVTGKKTFTLQINGDPEDLELMDSVTFKVNPSS